MGRRICSRAALRRAACATAVTAATLVMVPSAGAQKVVGTIPDQPDSAHLAAFMGAAQRMLTPAAFALANRGALALSPEQISALEALVRTAADSSRARMGRMTDRMRQQNASTPAPAIAAISSWSGPVDESGIRAAACEQSQKQAELMIGMIRDRHAVGAVLTAEQQHGLDRIQAELMYRAASGPH